MNVALIGLFAGMVPLLSLATAVTVVPEGPVGAKLTRLFDARLNGEKARGDILNETVDAFRTCYDDRHGEKPGPFGPWGWWQGEYWGKTMLSYCAHQRLSHDPAEREFIRAQALKLIREFQRPDGYLATYSNPDFIVGWNWNVWGRKYTLWALVEAFDVTGDRRLLDAAVKLAEHLDAQLVRQKVTLAETGCFAGLPSMSILKPLVRAYERSGNAACLRLAQAIVADNERADGRKPNLIANAFSSKPVHAWYPESQDWAKAYELMSCVEGLVDYGRVTKASRPLEAAKLIFDKLLTDELNAVFSVGYHDKFVAAATRPNTISEVCDVIHWMRLCRSLYEATGESRYLDCWERCFFNAYLAGIYRDGKWGAHDVRSHGRRHLQGVFEINMHYHFCCIDNAPRAAVDWYETALVARAADAIDLNFYTDGNYEIGDVAVTVSGNYPIGECITVAVTTPRELALNLRVPDWATGMTVDGRPARGPRHRVALQAGRHEVKLDFAMKPKIVRWAGTDCADDDPKLAEYLKTNFEMLMHTAEMKDSVRKNAGVRLLRGPLVLAKCQRAGDEDRTCLSDLGVDENWQVSLVPEKPISTWGLWRAEFSKGGEKKSVRVSDFASAADTDDWHNTFSIWM